MYQYANGRIAAHLLNRKSFITDPVLLSICPTLISLNKLRLKNKSCLAKNTVASRLKPTDSLRNKQEMLPDTFPKEYIPIKIRNNLFHYRKMR